VSRRALAVLWIGLLGTVPAPGAARALFVDNYINSNDVRGIAVWDAALALATRGGVVIYDPATGMFRKILRAPSGLPTNDITCVAVSPSGTLWAGTQGSGVARIRPDGGPRRTLTSFDGLPSDAVTTLYVRGDSIWVGTAGGVALFTEIAASGQVALRRVDTTARTAGGLIGDQITGFATVGDTLWCATTAGLSTFSQGTWTARSAALAGAVMPRGLAVHRDTLWAATSNGPYRYVSGFFGAVTGGHPSGGSWVVRSIGGTLYSGAQAALVLRYTGPAWSAVGPGGPPQAAVVDIAGGPDGALYAATRVGLVRYDGPSDSWIPVLSPGPLQDVFLPPSVHAAANAEGVWFTSGNNHAVVHYDGRTWETLTSQSTGGQLDNTSVFGLLLDRDGRVWLGHCCSGADPPPRLDRFDPAAGAWDRPPGSNFITLAQAPSGRVFAGGVEYGNGIYEYDATSGALLDSLTPSNTQGGIGPGLASNIIRDLEFDAAGKGWIALRDVGLDIWDGGGTPARGDDIWTHVSAGLPTQFNYSLAVESPSRAWLGTGGGLARIESGAVTGTWTPQTVPALPAPQVNDLALDAGGNVWIATDAGLAVLAPDGTLETYTVADGLVDDAVACLAWDDAAGAMWAGTAHGISRIVRGGGPAPGFSGRTYVYPNPVRESDSGVRLGGLTDAIQGEVRDPAGRLIRRFHADPTSTLIWDLTRPGGGAAAPGIYLVVLRDKGASRILRIAVLR
jgi:ligand-binding sensor domain-containing protein